MVHILLQRGRTTGESMRRWYVLGLASIWLLSVSAYAQQTDRIPSSERQLVEQTLRALETGTLERILEYARGSVRISMLGAQALYSPVQARYVLREFFQRHPPVRFVLTREAKRQRHLFLSGRLVTRKEEVFRIYIRFYREKEGWSLREIRIHRAG